jgi:RNase P/RNase MRP subunit POP5
MAAWAVLRMSEDCKPALWCLPSKTLSTGRLLLLSKRECRLVTFAISLIFRFAAVAVTCNIRGVSGE